MKILFYLISLFFGCNSFNPKPPEVITVEAPKSVSAKIDATDSIYLRVKLFHNNNYQIFLGKDSLTTKNIKLIDRFISRHIKNIDKDKVCVIGDSNARYTTFRDLKMVFKKYEIFRFRIETDAN